MPFGPKPSTTREAVRYSFVNYVSTLAYQAPYFALPVIVLTSGGPGDSTRSVVMYLAEQAFSNFQIGYASAIAITLFLIILAATLIQFRIRRSWVHYE